MIKVNSKYVLETTNKYYTTFTERKELVSIITNIVTLYFKIGSILFRHETSI